MNNKVLTEWNVKISICSNLVKLLFPFVAFIILNATPSPTAAPPASDAGRAAAAIP